MKLVSDKQKRVKILSLLAHLYRFLVKYLIDNGAQVNAVNSTEGANAAHWAAIAGKTSSLHLLFASGVDVQSVDKRGYNCLLHAVQSHDNSVSFVGNVTCTCLAIPSVCM